MRIFHGPNNIAGMAAMFAAAQRALGHESTAYCRPNHTFLFPGDKPFKPLPDAASTAEFAGKFDVFHFYFGESLDEWRLRDIPLLKKLGKAVFMYFCGCDARDSKHVIATRDFSGCSHCWPNLCSSNRDLAINLMRHYADAIFVSTPDLLETLPDAIWLPQPIELAKLTRLKQTHHSQAVGAVTAHRPLKIAHAPSSQALKGSKYVFEAMNSLIAEGANIELVLIENRPWEEALALYATADLAIDQLLIGAYGSLSVELMALGIPTICYLDPRTLSNYPEKPPILNASAFTLRDAVQSVLANPAQLQPYREQGPAYVARHHDAMVVAQHAVDSYQRALNVRSA